MSISDVDMPTVTPKIDQPNSICVACVSRFPTKREGRTVDNVFYLRPRYIGNSILLYGRKNSRFPFHAFVGPEWPCMIFTNISIIVPTYFFLQNVASQWHPIVMAIGCLTGLTVICAFLATALSDPGVHWIEDETEGGEDSVDTQGKTKEEKLESGQSSISSKNIALLPCGQCGIDRPRTAQHCYECGLCVNHLDHHCPWTGKCIGKNNLSTFYIFVWSLCTHILYVILMVIISAATQVDVVPDD